MAAHPQRMDSLLESLESAADKLNIKVSYESLAETAYGGGLCKVKGSYRVIIDKRATVGERVSTLVRALVGFDLDGIYLTPAARQLIDDAAALSGSTTPLRPAQVA